MSATPAAAEMCVLLQQRILRLVAAFAKGRAHLSPLRRVEARVIGRNRTWLRPFVRARHAITRRTGRLFLLPRRLDTPPSHITR